MRRRVSWIVVRCDAEPRQGTNRRGLAPHGKLGIRPGRHGGAAWLMAPDACSARPKSKTKHLAQRRESTSSGIDNLGCHPSQREASSVASNASAWTVERVHAEHLRDGTDSTSPSWPCLGRSLIVALASAVRNQVSVTTPFHRRSPVAVVSVRLSGPNEAANRSSPVALPSRGLVCLYRSRKANRLGDSTVLERVRAGLRSVPLQCAQPEWSWRFALQCYTTNPYHGRS